jgi:hypothetical protein
MTNSVVPMANALMVSASKAIGMTYSCKVDVTQYPGFLYLKKYPPRQKIFDSTAMIDLNP